MRHDTSNNPGNAGDWWPIVDTANDTVTLNPQGNAFAYSLGQVQVTEFTHYLEPGANPVGSVFASNAPIGSSGLCESGWVSDNDGLPNPQDEDVMRSFRGTHFKEAVFHHNGTLAPSGWYVDGTMNNDFPMEPAKGYLLFIKSDSGQLRWRQMVPYTAFYGIRYGAE